MLENLYLRLSESGVEWSLFDPAGGEVSARGSGDFDSLAELVEARQWEGEVIVLISASCVTLHQVNIPSKQPRQIRQAVPYAIEESLAVDTEDCHFALGQRASNGDIAVAVVSRGLFESWLDKLVDMGIPASFVAIDALQVPLFADRSQPRTTALIERNGVLMRTDDEKGYFLDRGQLASGISFLPEDKRASLDLWLLPEMQSEIDLAVNQMAAEFDTEIQIEPIDLSAFEFLCRNVNEQTINLLQGKYQVERKTSKNSSVWRSAAMLCGCALLLHLIMVTGQAIYLDMTATRYEAEARALYADVFPRDRNVTDIRRRWQSHLRGGKSDEGDKFVGLFSTAAGSLAGSSLILNNVNFNENRGDLILQLEAPRSEQLVLYSQTLSKLGLDAEIGTISQENNAVRGSIKVKSLGGD